MSVRKIWGIILIVLSVPLFTLSGFEIYKSIIEPQGNVGDLFGWIAIAIFLAHAIPLLIIGLILLLKHSNVKSD